MSQSTKKQHHEQARKKHRREQQEHARELARQKPSTTAAWVLGVVLALAVVGVVVASLR